jgi:hypothetical protein
MVLSSFICACQSAKLTGNDDDVMVLLLLFVVSGCHQDAGRELTGSGQQRQDVVIIVHLCASWLWRSPLYMWWWLLLWWVGKDY